MQPQWADGIPVAERDRRNDILSSRPTRRVHQINRLDGAACIRRGLCHPFKIATLNHAVRVHHDDDIRRIRFEAAQPNWIA